MQEKHHLPEMEEPFIAYGYGVIAFFSLLRSLIKIFAWLTFLCLFQMYWFMGGMPSSFA
jgi:hypothetical protein